MPNAARADQTQMEKIPIRVGPNGLLPLGELVSFRVMEEIVPGIFVAFEENSRHILIRYLEEELHLSK
jgi:hypothetical protein